MHSVPQWLLNKFTTDYYHIKVDIKGNMWTWRDFLHFSAILTSFEGYFTLRILVSKLLQIEILSLMFCEADVMSRRKKISTSDDKKISVHDQSLNIAILGKILIFSTFQGSTVSLLIKISFNWLCFLIRHSKHNFCYVVLYHKNFDS